MRLLELYTTDRKMRSSWERECYFFLDVMRRHYYLMHQARDQPQTWLVRLGGGDITWLYCILPSYCYDHNYYRQAYYTATRFLCQQPAL